MVIFKNRRTSSDKVASSIEILLIILIGRRGSVFESIDRSFFYYQIAMIWLRTLDQFIANIIVVIVIVIIVEIIIIIINSGTSLPMSD